MQTLCYANCQLIPCFPPPPEKEEQSGWNQLSLEISLRCCWAEMVKKLLPKDPFPPIIITIIVTILLPSPSSQSLPSWSPSSYHHHYCHHIATITIITITTLMITIVIPSPSSPQSPTFRCGLGSWRGGCCPPPQTLPPPLHPPAPTSGWKARERSAQRTALSPACPGCGAEAWDWTEASGRSHSWSACPWGKGRWSPGGCRRTWLGRPSGRNLENRQTLLLTLSKSPSHVLGSAHTGGLVVWPTLCRQLFTDV